MGFGIGLIPFHNPGRKCRKLICRNRQMDVLHQVGHIYFRQLRQSHRNIGQVDHSAEIQSLSGLGKGAGQTSAHAGRQGAFIKGKGILKL